MIKIKRRHFLLAGIGTAGALLIGWSLSPPRQRLLSSKPLSVVPGQVALNGWVKVSADNTVTVVMSQAEMGQGAHTGLAMLLADEMDAAWDQIKLEQSSFDTIYNNQASIVDSLPFQPDDHGVLKWVTERVVGNALREIPGLIGTGGSSSVKDQFLPLRQAGASARAMLISAAAEIWGVPAQQCAARAGRVSHTSGKSASYGELAAHAAKLPVPRRVELKHRTDFTLIGTAEPRIECTAKIDGSAMFGIDSLPPGVLYASIVMCPTLGGKVASFDAAAARALPGVHNVVVLQPVAGGLAGVGMTSGGIAVIATTRFQAMQAVKQVSVQWDHGAAAGLSSRSIDEELTRALDLHVGQAHYERGDVTAALQSAAKTVTAEYRVPFVAHAAMEPMNCTVQFKNGAATVWVGTQAPGLARFAVAKVLGIDASKVDLRVPYLGGGFGRRYFNDCIIQAAALARETGGLPVQLLWSREQDTTHDYYRSAFVSRSKAGFDSRGRLIVWQATSSGSSLGAPSVIDAATDGASNTAYEFPNARIAHQRVESGLPTGIWRSVNHSQNAFFTESFIDECAAAVQRDPVAFRIELLGNQPRHLTVLRRVAALCAWNEAIKPAQDGTPRARGIAIHRSFGSIVAQVAEVSLSADRRIRVHRVVCVVECGLAVNPNLIRQQMEGGIVFGLSAALQNEITIDKGQVQQSNFDDHLALRMDECPTIETDIIASQESPGGVGEAGVPPIAPAVANAVFALTGQRLRRLPLQVS